MKTLRFLTDVVLGPVLFVVALTLIAWLATSILREPEPAVVAEVDPDANPWLDNEADWYLSQLRGAAPAAPGDNP